MSTRRENIFIYLGPDVNPDQIEPLLHTGALTGEIRTGGFYQAFNDIQSGRMRLLPTYLVLDISNVENLEEAMNRLADSAPEGETEIIFTGPQNTVEFYKQMKSLGASEYVPYPITAERLFDVIRGLAEQTATANLDTSRIVAFVGVRGGVGTSTIASAAAHASAYLHGRQTLMLDLDVMQGIQHLLFRCEQTEGLREMLENPERVDPRMLDLVMQTAGPNLNVLSMASLNFQEQFSADAVKQIIRQAQQGMESVIIDVPARSQIDHSFLFTAGTIFLCVTPTIVGLRDALAYCDMLDAGSYPGKIVVALNRVKESRSGSIRRGEFEERLKSKVVEIVFDPRTQGQAEVENKHILEVKGPIITGLRKIAEELPTYTPPEPNFIAKLLGK